MWRPSCGRNLITKHQISAINSILSQSFYIFIGIVIQCKAYIPRFQILLEHWHRSRHRVILNLWHKKNSIPCLCYAFKLALTVWSFGTEVNLEKLPYIHYLIYVAIERERGGKRARTIRASLAAQLPPPTYK